MNRWLAHLILVVFVTLSGCGGDPYKFVPVSGKVTLDGKPLANANVIFQPVTKPGSGKAGETSRAVTGNDGRFTLTSSSGKAGAASGEHTIRITTVVTESQGDGVPAKIVKKELAPEKYVSGTPFTVPDAGTEEANFEMKAGG
ncbi:MAG: carboxypeptidase regulatory-like domain-containing protein [Pirellulales bacterium]